ncbi:PREDICTED: protein AKNAD1 [Myotis brandtii]|uniref:protein AKNAD1 n=1 Tax=Myotis brandtii TaxID=109478 RepID=UPI00070414DD|nr:PREDICTED: protein AKNAD1 [Myotis brandtii]
MDKAGFSERKASKQREDFPDDGGFSQTKLHADHNFSSENNILGVSDQVIPTAEDPQERAAHEGTCRNAGAFMTLGKMTEHAAKKKSDEEQCCLPTLHIPAKKGDRSKSDLSDVLQHHLSKEELLKGQGSPCETLPEVSRADSLDEAIVKSFILRYVKSFWPKEPTPELADQLNPPREDDMGSEPSCCPTMTAENTSETEEPVAAGDGSLPQSSTFLTKSKSPSNKQKGCQEQKLQTENTRSGPGFKYGQVCYRFSDRSSVAPQGKIPKNNTIDKPLLTDKQASFSPELRAGLALGQEIPEGTARPDRAEKEEQERKTGDPSQQTEVQEFSRSLAQDSPGHEQDERLMKPATHSHQEHLTGTGSETRLWKLSSTSQKDPFLSSSIFQKISQGREMCQKLKEQTDQLKTKVQEFSRSLAQDSPGHEQDERLELQKLQAHLELLKQEFVAEKQLTLEQQVHKPKSPAVSDYDPKRKAEGEVSRMEMLLEDVEGKVDEGKHTSAGSLPESSPTLPGGLPSASSPPSDEAQLRRSHSNTEKAICTMLLVQALFIMVRKDPRHTSASGRQQCAETTGRSCAFCHRVLEWKQTLEKKGHRRTSCGGLPIALQEKAPHPDSLLSKLRGLGLWVLSLQGPSLWGLLMVGTSLPLATPNSTGPSTGLQSNTCETCGTRTPNCPRGGRKEPLKEFHYRYDTPGQNYLNHSEGRAFVQFRFLNENKNSPPSYSKPNWICSQRANSKSSQDEREPKPGKKKLKAPMTSTSDLATSSPHFHSGRVSGSKSLSDVSSDEETKSEGLAASLDHALRTANILKETTDQMIRTIAEDLAKLQRWRNRLKY